MSRTFRRLKRHLIDQNVDRPSDIWDWEFDRYQTNDVARIRIIQLHRYIGDGGSHRYPCGVPRWYRRIHGSKATRLANKREIHRCIAIDTWDDHKPHFLRDNAAYSWW
jgi:hypothetical protein